MRRLFLGNHGFWGSMNKTARMARSQSQRQALARSSPRPPGGLKQPTHFPGNYSSTLDPILREKLDEYKWVKIMVLLLYLKMETCPSIIKSQNMCQKQTSLFPATDSAKPGTEASCGYKGKRDSFGLQGTRHPPRETNQRLKCVTEVCFPLSFPCAQPPGTLQWLRRHSWVNERESEGMSSGKCIGKERTGNKG